MGHWQQIGRDNAAERERRAKLPRCRRVLGAEIGTTIFAAVWVAISVFLVCEFANIWLVVKFEQLDELAEAYG